MTPEEQALDAAIKAQHNALQQAYGGPNPYMAQQGVLSQKQIDDLLNMRPGSIISVPGPHHYAQNMWQNSSATSVVGLWHQQGRAGKHYVLRCVKHLPDTLGWRQWNMDPDGCLVSPQWSARWEDGELRVPLWDQSDAVRGVSGIHALLAPEQWRELAFPEDYGRGQVSGLVERFGNFVLGEDGWRAEWVIIRELVAPNQAAHDLLRAYYPDIPIHFDAPQQEDSNGHRKGHRDRNTGATSVQAIPDDGAEPDTFTAGAQVRARTSLAYTAQASAGPSIADLCDSDYMEWARNGPTTTTSRAQRVVNWLWNRLSALRSA